MSIRTLNIESLLATANCWRDVSEEAPGVFCGDCDDMDMTAYDITRRVSVWPKGDFKHGISFTLTEEDFAAFVAGLSIKKE
jgi:hypothetical protein